jgi:hypothetical protein
MYGGEHPAKLGQKGQQHTNVSLFLHDQTQALLEFPMPYPDASDYYIGR